MTMPHVNEDDSKNVFISLKEWKEILCSFLRIEYIPSPYDELQGVMIDKKWFEEFTKIPSIENWKEI